MYLATTHSVAFPGFSNGGCSRATHVVMRILLRISHGRNARSFTRSKPRPARFATFSIAGQCVGKNIVGFV